MVYFSLGFDTFSNALKNLCTQLITNRTLKGGDCLHFCFALSLDGMCLNSGEHIHNQFEIVTIPEHARLSPVCKLENCIDNVLCRYWACISTSDRGFHFLFRQHNKAKQLQTYLICVQAGSNDYGMALTSLIMTFTSCYTLH